MQLKALYCLLVLVAGCAQVPRPYTYPYRSQQKMQAADHWHLLASQVVGEVATNLKGGLVSSIESIYVQCGSYVRCVSDDRAHFKITPFDQAFHSFLITELTKQGIPVSFNPDNRLKLDWVVQPVVHNAYRIKPHPSLAEAIDVWSGIEAGSLPHSEIIITTTLTDRGAIWLRNANIFYINDQDWQHYWSIPNVPDTPKKAYAVVTR
jgi:hypothetical protein